MVQVNTMAMNMRQKQLETHFITPGYQDTILNLFTSINMVGTWLWPDEGFSNPHVRDAPASFTSAVDGSTRKERFDPDAPPHKQMLR